MKELDAFIESWGDDSPEVKELFVKLYATAKELPNTTLQYTGRPGISHSLRIGAKGDEVRPFFVMVDVIDDEPEARWISMCMYADVADDPEERGDWIPKGLNGEDAVCFSVDETEEDAVSYLAEVLRKAAATAQKK